MTIKDIILKIQDSGQDEPWDLLVTGWDVNGQGMIDEALIEAFPMLSMFDLYDLQEGAMEYYGKLTKNQLKTQIEQLGFTVEII